MVNGAFLVLMAFEHSTASNQHLKTTTKQQANTPGFLYRSILNFLNNQPCRRGRFFTFPASCWLVDVVWWLLLDMSLMGAMERWGTQ